MKKKYYTLLEVIIGFFIFAVVIGVPMAFWSDRNLDWLVSTIKGEECNVPFILSWALTVFTNIVGIGFNIICEVARLFV
jgi:hypothetical protein